MDRNEFEEFIKHSPRYTRLIFCYGPQLFIRDGDEYRNLAMQVAYEVWLNRLLYPNLNNQVGDGIARRRPVPQYVPTPPLQILYADEPTEDYSKLYFIFWIVIGVALGLGISRII